MFALLVIFLIIDAIAAFILYRQAFVERSNMNRKYRTRLLWLMVAILGALIASRFNISLACILAGIPVLIAGLFFIPLALALLFYKGPWR